ncbi:MAG TPA: hypothetical protein VGY48_24850, partial [Vicinamibacterales bacterium]|nr:hypothetical protein [Vicinamibacterales bacterium]
MRPTATFAFAGSLLAAGLLGLYFGWLLHRPGPPGPTFGLRVYFDGGYAFDRTKSDSVDVDSLRNANYPMKVKYGPQGTQLLDVKNYTLSLLPDGKTP